MNLNEVVDLLKEIVENCSNLQGDDFLLAPSKVPQSSVEGYEIHLTESLRRKRGNTSMI